MVARIECRSWAVKTPALSLFSGALSLCGISGSMSGSIASSLRRKSSTAGLCRRRGHGDLRPVHELCRQSAQGPPTQNSRISCRRRFGGWRCVGAGCWGAVGPRRCPLGDVCSAQFLQDLPRSLHMTLSCISRIASRTPLHSLGVPLEGGPIVRDYIVKDTQTASAV